MQKSSLCDTHFIVGCKLCFDGPTVVPPYNPAPDTSILVNTPVVGSYEPPIQTTSLPQPLPVTSSAAVKVTTASDDYAQACDKYKESCDAVDNMIDHIERMKSMLIELQDAKAAAKERKSELKKKVLESLVDED